MDNLGCLMNQLFQSQLRRNIINSSAFVEVLPEGYHPFVCALKSPRTTTKYVFLRANELRLRSRLSAKDSNSSLD